MAPPLAEEIPRASLLTLEGAGHGVDRADWEPVAHAIRAHTAQEAAATAGSDLTSGHCV